MAYSNRSASTDICLGWPKYHALVSSFFLIKNNLNKEHIDFCGADLLRGYSKKLCSLVNSIRIYRGEPVEIYPTRKGISDVDYHLVGVAVGHVIRHNEKVNILGTSLLCVSKLSSLPLPTPRG